MLLPEFCEELFYIKEINIFDTSFKNYLKKVLEYNILTTLKWLQKTYKYNNFTIKELKKFKYIDISFCQLTKIPTLNFQNNLHTLFLNNNQLKSIPIFNFPNLLSLSLYSNQLTSISLKTPNLISLDLANNQLTSVSLNLPNLKVLHLDNNQLTSILDLTLTVPKLELLFIYNNPLPETEKNRLKSICDKVYL